MKIEIVDVQKSKRHCGLCFAVLFDFPRRVDRVVTKTRGRLTTPKMPPETSRHCRDGLVFLRAFLLFPGSVRRRRLRSVVPADEDQSQSKSYR